MEINFHAYLTLTLWSVQRLENSIRLMGFYIQSCYPYEVEFSICILAVVCDVVTFLL